MTTTTVADLISETQRHLYGMHRAEYNRVNGALTTSTTDISFDFDLKGLVAGTTVALEDELVYVWSTNTTSKVATVERGWQGTTAAAHDDGVVAEIAPRFPSVAIREALLNEIRSWSDAIYQVDTYLLSTTSSTTAYDLPVDPFYDVLDVRRNDSSDARWRRINYEVVRNADLSTFASGLAIQIRDAMPTTADLQVVYSKPLTLDYFDDGIDLTEDIGLPVTALDIPPLGAAWRLLAPREIKRTFTESKGEQRTTDEVPGGLMSQTANNLKRLRDQRLDEEAARLRARTAWRF